MRPAIITFTVSGAELAQRVAALVDGVVHPCGPGGADARTLLSQLFRSNTPIIGICASGILIRLLAPLLDDKHTEPPVLAVSTDGRHVVPLLGGHHGANRMARELAAALGGTAAITTASDARFTRGLDEPPDGIVLSNPAGAKRAMAAALRGEPVAAAGETAWLHEAGYTVAAGPDPLVYIARNLVAGVGCERGADPSEVIALIEHTLARAALPSQSLAAIATIDIKADEPALHAAAAHFGVPLRLFTAEELAAERDRLPNPSAVVEAETGTPGVAEAAALKVGALAVEKQKSRRATCAIGIAPSPLDPATLGRAPGVLHLVGIGPGNVGQRTASAVATLETSSDWVGYGLYLDLISDLRHGQNEHRFPLGEETERVRHALELAAAGRTVALVCSGDPQIYAMAALAMELLEGPSISAAARRVALMVHPGISAVQAASAAAGALIGHDFCCISLSDLLTPRGTILQRLDAAARGDFVTAFYNPRSGRRTELINVARGIMLQHRPLTTPVIVARNLGRPDQQVTVTTLADFDPSSVDMLTIVLVGASTSRVFQRGDGRFLAYTPRGYPSKPTAEAPQ